MARTALEAAGIDTMIRSDDCGGLRPHLWLGGVQLVLVELPRRGAFGGADGSDVLVRARDGMRAAGAVGAG